MKLILLLLISIAFAQSNSNSYYPNGRLKSTINHATGFCTVYHPNGQAKLQGIYLVKRQEFARAYCNCWNPQGDLVDCGTGAIIKLKVKEVYKPKFPCSNPCCPDCGSDFSEYSLDSDDEIVKCTICLFKGTANKFCVER